MFRVSVFLLAGIGLFCTDHVAAQNDKQAFAKRALKAVIKDNPSRRCEIAEGGAMIVCGDVQFGLENVRREITSNTLPDESIDDFIRVYYGLAMASAYDGINAPNEASQTKIATQNKIDTSIVNRLYPQIVPSSYREQLGDENVSELSPGLLIAYVIDESDRYAYVLDHHVEEWNMSRDSIMEHAYSNLAEKALQTDIGLSDSSIGNDSASKWLSIDVKDGFAAARVLLPEVRERIAHELGEQFYIAMPNRDFLIAWSLDFKNHLGFMSAVKQDFESQSHPISPNLYIGTKDEIRPATSEELFPPHVIQFD